MEQKHTAIVMSAGKGSRMKSVRPKQYLDLGGKPVLYYALAAFEESFVDEIILVAGKEDISYCAREIIGRYGFTKTAKIVPGGAERYESVYEGLKAAEDADFVYIHDGARPFIDQAVLNRAKDCVLEYGACAAGMPVKDTIKIADENEFVVQTPERRRVWQIQTPQAFSYPLVREAYDRLMAEGGEKTVTDDAMVVEEMTGHPVKLFAASYENIKITTPEDLRTAAAFLQENV